MKWYEESGHVITFDKERNQLHEDVFAFLESLIGMIEVLT